MHLTAQQRAAVLSSPDRSGVCHAAEVGCQFYFVVLWVCYNHAGGQSGARRVSQKDNLAQICLADIYQEHRQCFT